MQAIYTIEIYRFSLLINNVTKLISQRCFAKTRSQYVNSMATGYWNIPNLIAPKTHVLRVFSAITVAPQIYQFPSDLHS